MFLSRLTAEVMSEIEQDSGCHNFEVSKLHTKNYHVLVSFDSRSDV